ncbi:MAG: Two component sensor kinase [Eubacterium sp.]|jgi:signal transduction histidine kinase|nr:Two component sensor kinase [Eubacterium sp.]
MKKKKDRRINTSFISIKDFVGILLALMIINGCYVMIYLTFVKEGNGSVNYIAPAMVGYLCFMTLIVCVLSGIIRHNYFSSPMRRLGEAARRIALGDFSVRVAPLRKDGKKDYVEVMFEDFNKMAEELTTIETLKSDFIANVSHEIKTPLSVIQSYANALRNNELTPEERSEYTKTIITASQKLSELVTNILKLNKLENQEILPEASPYDLSEQLRCCALAFEDLWENKGITFTADLDEVIVSYDEGMLELVWNNLISNSIKFTGTGGSISLKLIRKDGFAVVSVTDSGCGMDEETGKHIFDKFYQGDTSHSQQGNGLGLTLVMKVIEILKGEITVDSKPGYGTTFTVCLKI